MGIDLERIIRGLESHPAFESVEALDRFVAAHPMTPEEQELQEAALDRSLALLLKRIRDCP